MEALVVKADKAAVFEGLKVGYIIPGSMVFPGITKEHVIATITRTGRVKQGKFYECRLSYFGVDLGEQCYLVKDAGNG